MWSCGVTLYVMLVGSYPFEDPRDPKNFKKTVKKITTAEYTIPQGLPLSAACLDLISKVKVVGMHRTNKRASDSTASVLPDQCKECLPIHVLLVFLHVYARSAQRMLTYPRFSHFSACVCRSSLWTPSCASAWTGSSSTRGLSRTCHVS